MTDTGTRRRWRKARRHDEQIPSGGGDATREESVTVGATAKLMLRSADEPLCFTACVFIEAWWGGPHTATPALFDIARRDITRRAEELSRGHTLTAAERLRGDLNAVLHQWRGVPDTYVMARGQCVSVSAEPELVTAVAAREEAHRRQLVVSWSDEHRTVRTERMGALILDPLRATAAWFLDNQDKPEEVVAIAEKFQQLRETLLPQQERDTPGRLLDELLTSVDELRQTRVYTMLDKMFRNFSRADLVVRLHRPDAEAEESQEQK